MTSLYQCLSRSGSQTRTLFRITPPSPIPMSRMERSRQRIWYGSVRRGDDWSLPSKGKAERTIRMMGTTYPSSFRLLHGLDEERACISEGIPHKTGCWLCSAFEFKQPRFLGLFLYERHKGLGLRTVPLVVLDNDDVVIKTGILSAK